MNQARIFYLYRRDDVSGVSGRGFVAEGVHLKNGKAVISWFGEKSSTVIYDNIETAIAIHGHQGKTLFVFEDSDYIDENGKLILNGDTGFVEAETGKWIGINDKHPDEMRIGEFIKKKEEDEWLKNHEELYGKKEGENNAGNN